jgi:hypothetical protein
MRSTLCAQVGTLSAWAGPLILQTSRLLQPSAPLAWRRDEPRKTLPMAPASPSRRFAALRRVPSIQRGRQYVESLPL